MSVSEQLIHGKTPQELDYILRNVNSKAIQAIRNELSTFSSINKENPEVQHDVLTSADTAAQKVYQKLLSKHFPKAGLIGEEENLRTECTDKDQKLIWVFDPLDGTKQFDRGGQHSVGSQLAAVLNGKIIASGIQNVMSKDGVYLNSTDGSVSRYLSEGKKVLIDKTLQYQPSQRKKSLLMFEDPRDRSLFPGEIADISSPTGYHGHYSPTSDSLPRYFQSLNVATGSFGTNAMDLPLNIRTAMLTKPTNTNPWDIIPVVGIQEALGFKKFEYNPKQKEWSELIESWSLENKKEGIVLAIHQSEFPEFLNWFRKRNKLSQRPRPETKKQITLEEFANEIGFEVDKSYTITDWHDIERLQFQDGSGYCIRENDNEFYMFRPNYRYDEVYDEDNAQFDKFGVLTKNNLKDGSHLKI